MCRALKSAQIGHRLDFIIIGLVPNWGSCFRLQHSFGLIVSVATSRQRRTVDFRLSHAFAMAAVGAFVARLAVSNVA